MSLREKLQRWFAPEIDISIQVAKETAEWKLSVIGADIGEEVVIRRKFQPVLDRLQRDFCVLKPDHVQCVPVKTVNGRMFQHLPHGEIYVVSSCRKCKRERLCWIERRKTETRWVLKCDCGAK